MLKFKGFAKSVCVALSALMLIGSVNLQAFAAGGSIDGVVINEVCSSNKKSLKDSDGDAPDWVELYNTGSKAVNLKGARLTDDPATLDKWVFPDVTIGAGEYLIVFCSDKTTKGSELHTGYKLSGGNDTLVLSASNGTVVDKIALPDTKEDMTYGRLPNGTGDFTLMNATPGAANKSSVGVAAPVFSKSSGFYSSAFDLEVTASKGTTIYYTTDGSVPTTSSKKYSSKIKVYDKSSEKATLMYKKGTTVDSNNEYIPGGNFDRGMVVRAIAVDSKGNKSDVTTCTYFIGSDIANKYKKVAVISVVSDPNGLYNSKTGIFVAGNVFKEWRAKNPSGTLDGNTPANFNQRGREWEREAHVDFFEAGGKLGFAIDCGMRVQGGWSRNSTQKSMKFYMRSDYGSSKLSYKLFDDNLAYDTGKVVKSYKRFMIRNGGNDSFTLKFKCPWTQSLVSDLNFATQSGKLVVCFLDGEYWGMYTMNEVYDDNYIESNYGVPADDAVMMKAGELEEGVEGDEKLFWDAMYFVESNDMSKPENYAKACELFDMDSLLDYFATELYIGNQDWQWGNWACWRSRSTDKTDSPYQDGKWRFMLYDTEFAMDLYGNGNDYKYSILSELVNKGEGSFGKFLKSLMKNQEFKSAFIVTMEKVANVNFYPEHASKQLQSYYNEYSPVLRDHFSRFIGWQSVEGVRKNTESFKTWLTKRNGYINTLLKNELKLGTIKENTLTITRNDAKGGTVSFDGTDIRFINNKWSAKLISGYKVEIVATPAEGYEFTGWSGSYNGTEPAIRINPSKALNLKANFAKKK